MIGLLMMLAAQSSYPVYFDGNDLYARCQERDQSVCLAYVIAVHDTLDDLADAEIIKATFCAPATATPGQLKDVAVMYLHDHPALRAQGAGGLVAASFMEAFPCPKQ